MCLVTKTERLKVAKEDIKCYKRVAFFLIGDEINFETPHQCTIVPIDVLLGKQEFSALGNLEAKKGENGEYLIFGGVIHTYAYKWDACINQCHNELVVDCIIPKGTKYIEGYDGSGFKTIAAQKIKVDGFKNEEEIKKQAIRIEKMYY